MSGKISKNGNVVLAIAAHPDDVEFLCAGTLAMLHQQGWQVHTATMTAGDCGSRERSPEEISLIRKTEARKAAERIDAGYTCLECKDLFIMYDRPTLLKVIKLIRQIQPEVVMAMSPSCYMVDHETTSKVVQTACFASGMVNVKTDSVPPFFNVPYLYYMDPMEGKDKFGTHIEPGFIVDITSVIDIKEQMLARHESQRKWLMEHHGMDEYMDAMKQLSSERGNLAGVTYGEGFRQHLGHAYPQENILQKVLGNAVKTINRKSIQ